jgi:BirA family biotin operon repressor/biotin-[acetyl-CoA-carboxylase] ligase
MNTLFVGKKIMIPEQVASTNSYAMELLSNTKPVAGGTVIMAVSQSAGRGQQGNSWEAEPGKNLTLSLVLYPDFLEAGKQFYLSKIISLAVAEVVRSYVQGEVRVKWPNDIYYGRRKLGGVLIENILMGSSIKTSVAGIGLNVNQEQFACGPQAISLKNITGKETDLGEVLETLCEAVEKRYFQLKAGKFGEIDEEYLTHLFRLEEYAAYRSDKGLFHGTITGVSEEGRLRILTHNAEEEYDLREIQFII